MKTTKMQDVKSNFVSEEVREILDDRSSTGRKRPWEEFKVDNGLLALSYESLGMVKKANRVRDCATALSFSYNADAKKKTLVAANFCRVRLCPMCQWRRSLKVFGQVSKILKLIESKQHYAYILVTFTVKNVPGEELGDELDRLMKAWKRLVLLKPFTQAIKGYYRAMEISHNVDYKSKDFNTFHPHFHCLFAVNPSYFTGKEYLSHKKWQELWKAAARLDYMPMVNVQRVKEDNEKSLLSAVAEAAKYAVKTDQYILPDDWDLTTDTVRLLDATLHNRRFVGFGGIMKDAKKALNLDDVENGDLVSIGDDDVKISDDDPIYTYYWNSGYSQYILGKD